MKMTGQTTKEAVKTQKERPSSRECRSGNKGPIGFKRRPERQGGTRCTYYRIVENDVVSNHKLRRRPNPSWRGLAGGEQLVSKARVKRVIPVLINSAVINGGGFRSLPLST